MHVFFRFHCQYIMNDRTPQIQALLSCKENLVSHLCHKFINLYKLYTCIVLSTVGGLCDESMIRYFYCCCLEIFTSRLTWWHAWGISRIPTFANKSTINAFVYNRPKNMIPMYFNLHKAQHTLKYSTRLCLQGHIDVSCIVEKQYNDTKFIAMSLSLHWAYGCFTLILFPISYDSSSLLK